VTPPPDPEAQAPISDEDRAKLLNMVQLASQGIGPQTVHRILAVDARLTAAEADRDKQANKHAWACQQNVRMQEDLTAVMAQRDEARDVLKRTENRLAEADAYGHDQRRRAEAAEADVARLTRYKSIADDMLATVNRERDEARDLLGHEAARRVEAEARAEAAELELRKLQGEP